MHLEKALAPQRSFFFFFFLSKTMEALCKQHVEVSKASAGCFHPIVIHSRTCSGCVPSFEQTRISGGRNNGFGKQILESFSVNSGNNNILAPSIVLTKGEIEFHTPELA